MNKLSIEDRPAHDWYRFVLSYPPHLVREYADRFNLKPRHRVLDPFCGTGTTLVECKKLGIPSVGIEANPVAHFASTVKLDWSPSPDGLLKHASQIAKGAISELESQHIDDNGLPLFSRSREGEVELKTLPEEIENLLLGKSISPLPLHKVLVLKDSIGRNNHRKYSAHERLALAKSIVYSTSNLRFGPEVGLGRAKPNAAAVGPWIEGVRRMAEDLRDLRPFDSVEGKVLRADSRQVRELLEPNSVDAVITSPPYPNEKDYTRTTRLELVLLDFVNSKSDLRALKRDLVRSNTRSVYKEDDDDRWIAESESIQRIAKAIEERRLELGKTSGFERLYGRVTKLYFGGMARHLGSLRRVLRPGARLAYVVGDQASYLRVMIRTGELLAELAESLGYEVIGTDLFRTRIATATKAALREEVLVLLWPGRRLRKPRKT